MLKKSIYLAVLLICLFTVNAFAQKAAPKQPAKPAAKPAPLNDSDFQIGPAKIGEKIDLDFAKVFGRYTGSKSGGSEEEKRIVIYDFDGNVEITTCDDIIVGIEIKSSNIKTNRGLKLHSEFKKAIEIYGQPNSKKTMKQKGAMTSYISATYGNREKGIKMNYNLSGDFEKPKEDIGYIYIYDYTKIPSELTTYFNEY